MAKKPSMGRQKIKIEKIEVKNHLQVTFSKRRSGLFKKASELCTLCGVEIGIIVFSPANKVFSFGHPNVESIIDRFLQARPGPSTANVDPFLIVEAHRNAGLREMNQQLGQITEEVEMEKKRGDNLDNMRKANQNHYWWESPIEKLGLEELEQVREAMEELKKSVNQHMTKMMNPPAPTTSIFGVGVFDQYEAKPMNHHALHNNNNNMAMQANNNFGCAHGFF